MSDTGRPSDRDEIDYVGAPTEYADVQEMPGWVQTAVKALVALPALFAALSVIELALLCGVLVIVAAVVLLVLAL